MRSSDIARGRAGGIASTQASIRTRPSAISSYSQDGDQPTIFGSTRAGMASCRDFARGRQAGEAGDT